MRNAFRKIFGQRLDQLLIQHIALGDSQNTAFTLQIRVILDQFAQKDFIFLLDIIRIGRHHKQEQRIAFDMAQEP